MRPLLFALLANDDEGLPGLSRLTPAVQDGLILMGAFLFVIGAFLFWILVIRKKKRRTSNRHRHRHRKSAIKTAVAGVSEIKQLIRERQRRRRREHRPRNPTLAETGGLPPPRVGNDSGPPASSNQT